MDDGSPSSGIERAASQGIDAFEAQQFPDPMPAPPPTPFGPPTQPGIIGRPSPNDLYTRPFVMQGGWHVTPDHMSWWNGVMWVPGRPPGPSGAKDTTTPTSPSAIAPLVLFLVGLAAVAAVGFIAWQAFQAMPTLGPGPPLP